MNRSIFQGAIGLVARAFLLGAVFAHVGGAVATPFTPTADAETVETLPLESSQRKQQRQLRQSLAQNPQNSQVALQAAQAYLEQARIQGDARYAGLAMGVLSGWNDDRAAPADLWVMKATVAQFLHDFDASRAWLDRALALQPQHPQALITLATVHRVQGQLAASDAACRRLEAAGVALHGAACLAENQSLRGETEAARIEFKRLLSLPAARLPGAGALRQWLWTSVAELEERAGAPAQAEAAWRKALGEGELGYVNMGWADFLWQQGRPKEVLALLDKSALTDAVLLRLCLAAQATGDARLALWQPEMAARFAASTGRPEAARTHAREQALFALFVSRQTGQALTLARANLTLQRESIDFWVFDQAALAQKDPSARRQAQAELRRLLLATGIQDARLSIR